jgi:ribosome-associated protein
MPEDALHPTRSVRIPLEEIVVRASRSSGPGGQHANVTASRVEVVLDLDSSQVLGEGERRRLHARYGPRVTAVAQETRSQARNRELALARLRERLREGLTVRRARRTTRPTAASRVRRADTKRRQAERKRGRRRPGEDD